MAKSICYDEEEYFIKKDCNKILKFLHTSSKGMLDKNCKLEKEINNLNEKQKQIELQLRGCHKNFII